MLCMQTAEVGSVFCTALYPKVEQRSRIKVQVVLVKMHGNSTYGKCVRTIHYDAGLQLHGC